MYDLVIIGAGPAGMTAALYALRAGKSALVLESQSFGGQIVYSPRVENFPSVAEISGEAFASNMIDQITALGADIEFACATNIEDFGASKKVICDDGSEYEGKTVIIATGVKHRKLGLENEDELVGQGVSYCAVCDGAFFRGKEVCVVGGGDTALQDALYLSTYCKRVYLIHRRDSFRAETKLVNRVKNTDNIELVLNCNVTKLQSTEDGMLSSVTVADNTCKERSIEASGIFIAVGQIPENKNFEGFASLDKDGYFDADETLITRTNGIFVAGDCRRKSVRQLTTAVSDGAVAGLAACRYIDNN